MTGDNINTQLLYRDVIIGFCVALLHPEEFLFLCRLASVCRYLVGICEPELKLLHA